MIGYDSVRREAPKVLDSASKALTLLSEGSPVVGSQVHVSGTFKRMV